MLHKGIFTFLALLLMAGPAAAMDATDKCAVAKINEAGKYAKCLLSQESKAIKKGLAPDFTKCDQSYDKKWAKIEQKGGGACPTLGDASSVQDTIIADCDALAGRLAGGGSVGSGELRVERTIASITMDEGPRHIAVNDEYGNPIYFTAEADGTCVEVSVDPSGNGILVDAVAELCEEEITLNPDTGASKTLTVKVYDPMAMHIGGGLFITYVNDYDFVWNQHGTDADFWGSFLAPRVPDGWHMLGHIALRDQSPDPPNNPLVDHPMIVVKADPSSDALEPAQSFTNVWTCSSGTHNVRVWTPNCRSGYVGLGFLARDYGAPDPNGNPAAENIRCVKAEYTVGAQNPGDWVWVSHGIEANALRPLSTWYELGPAETPNREGVVPLNPGTHFYCAGHLDCPGDGRSRANYLLTPLEVMERVEESLREPSIDELGGLDPGTERSRSEVRVPHSALLIMEPGHQSYSAYYAENAVDNSPFYRLSRMEEYFPIAVSECQLCPIETQIVTRYNSGYEAGSESTYSETYGMEVSAGVDASFKGVGMSSSVTFSTEFSWSSTYSELYSESLEVEFVWPVPAHTWSEVLQVKSLWNAQSEDGQDSCSFPVEAKKKHLKYVQWPP